MYGAMLGDIIGSPYEFYGMQRTKDFPLFKSSSRFTDDTVMTFAISEAIMNCGLDGNEIDMKNSMVESCQKWGRKESNAGYGGTFYHWIFDENPMPYNSYGNGSAMRVSSVGWFYDTLERTREVARWSAKITHNHEEGIKGAESVASAIWLARNRKSKEEIKQYIEKEFGYDLDTTCDKIRPNYKFDVSCQGSVPQAIVAFMDGVDYEDCVRNAVSLGGDTDTQGAIAGSIAEAFFGINENLKDMCRTYMTDDMKKVIKDFDNLKKERIN